MSVCRLTEKNRLKRIPEGGGQRTATPRGVSAPLQPSCWARLALHVAGVVIGALPALLVGLGARSLGHDRSFLNTALHVASGLTIRKEKFTYTQTTSTVLSNLSK